MCSFLVACGQRRLHAVLAVKSAHELRSVLPRVFPLRKPTLIRVAINHSVWDAAMFRDLTG